jgi:hypothetical protein
LHDSDISSADRENKISAQRVKNTRDKYCRFRWSRREFAYQCLIIRDSVSPWNLRMQHLITVRIIRTLRRAYTQAHSISLSGYLVFIQAPVYVVITCGGARMQKSGALMCLYHVRRLRTARMTFPLIKFALCSNTSRDCYRTLGYLFNSLV